MITRSPARARPRPAPCRCCAARRAPARARRGRRGRPRRRRRRRPTGSPAGRPPGRRSPRKASSIAKAMPPRSRSSAFSQRRLHAQRAAGAVDPAVERDDPRRRAAARGAPARVAVTASPMREPAGEALGHPEVDQDARAVVDGGELGVGVDLGARLHRQDADDAADRRADRAPLERQRRVAQPRARRSRAASRASRSATSVAAPRACSCSTRSSVASASATASSARVERDRLGLVVEPRDDVARAPPVARDHREREQPPGDERRDRDRMDRAAVADRRDPARRLRQHHLRADDHHRAGRRGPAAPAGPGPAAAPSAAGRPSRASSGAASGRNAAQAATAARSGRAPRGPASANSNARLRFGPSNPDITRKRRRGDPPSHDRVTGNHAFVTRGRRPPLTFLALE